MTTVLSRRAFLALTAAGGVAAGVRLRPATAAPASVPVPGAGGPLYLSACSGTGGAAFYAGFTPDGAKAFEVPLPERGHGAALRPGTTEVAAFARRPGRFLVVIDHARGGVVHRIDAAARRHFYGHGVFSPDGATLYCTENAYDEEGAGVLGVYDASDGYRRIGEIATGGIGPHELRLMADGRTLVIAQGGMQTHPDMERVTLNLNTMRPALLYMDRESGALLDKVEPPTDWHQNSIRHLSVTADGLVVAGLQFQGSPRKQPPLVLMHRRGAAPRWLEADAGVQRRMRNYCGSVEVDAAGTTAAVSAPRGGMITFWSLADARFLWAAEVPDGCGVVADGTPGGFMVTSGAGGGRVITGRDTATVSGDWLDARRWDNHLLRVG